jgi:Bacterial low temperature requirement A protein (LtrA)
MSDNNNNSSDGTTIITNGNGSKGTKDINYYKKEIKKEKAGKRKLYHSLIKLADELKRLRRYTADLQENDQYRNQAWYEGGLWRAPQVLPEVHREISKEQRARPREAISLSDMFLNLVIVTGFTRVGLAITSTGQVQVESVLYFAVFWTIWGKEASYSSRFDTTDLSAQFETLLTCFAVLFASLSVSLPMNSEGGARIMMMAGFCSFLHVCLMGRVLWWYMDAQISTVEHHVKHYALYNTLMNMAETATWILGWLYAPPEWRWIIFLVAVLMALRIPRAFLANDFHGELWSLRLLFRSFLVYFTHLVLTSLLRQLQILKEASCSFYYWGSCSKVSWWSLPTFLSTTHPTWNSIPLLAQPVCCSFASSCYIAMMQIHWRLIMRCWSTGQLLGFSTSDNSPCCSAPPLWEAV